MEFNFVKATSKQLMPSAICSLLIATAILFLIKKKEEYINKRVTKDGRTTHPTMGL